MKVTQSCRILCDPMRALYSPWNSPGQSTGVSGLFLHQGIFPTQGSNPGLPHFRQFLYQLSHKGSPRIFPTQGSNPGLPHCRQFLYQLSYKGSPRISNQGLLHCRQILYQWNYQGSPKFCYMLEKLLKNFRYINSFNS